MQEYASLLIITTITFMIFSAGLCISLILTGKNRIQRGTCAYDPTEKNRSPDCEDKTDCPICSPNSSQPGKKIPHDNLSKK